MATTTTPSMTAVAADTPVSGGPPLGLTTTLSHDVLRSILRRLPLVERHSSAPRVSQALRVAAYAATAETGALTLRVRAAGDGSATLRSLQLWLAAGAQAASISCIIVERSSEEGWASSALPLAPPLSLCSRLRSLRLLNVGPVDQLLPQLPAAVSCLESLELHGATHGSITSDGDSSIVTPIPTAAWEPFVTAAGGSLTSLVLVQCMTERSSVPLMLEHLTALRQLELSYVQHGQREGDAWSTRGRLVRRSCHAPALARIDWRMTPCHANTHNTHHTPQPLQEPLLQPWLDPAPNSNLGLGNLPFSTTAQHKLRALTLKGVHLEDAHELGNLTGLTKLNLKRWTFGGAAGVTSLLQAVGSLTDLRELAIGQTSLSPAHASAFCGIARLEQLTSLDLHWCVVLCVGGAAGLCRAIPAHTAALTSSCATLPSRHHHHRAGATCPRTL
jgi:hypothetical protein